MLDQKGQVKRRVLEHGSGHGKDAETFGWEKYDPYYQPDKPKGKFDTILSTFVLNVLHDERDRQAVLEDIQGSLSDSGTAFITVRADTDQLKGWTSKGTWQGLIELDLPVVHHTSWYTTYVLEH